MSSNVGLTTPRGSGTSGYVQRNLSTLKPRDTGFGAPYPPHNPPNFNPNSNSNSYSSLHRQPDQAILLHDRQREVEVQVFALRAQLEDEADGNGDGDVDEEEVEKRCEALRMKLLGEMEGKGGMGRRGRRRGALKPHQVHELAEAKIEESERLRKALGIREGREGRAWDDRLVKVKEEEEEEEKEKPERGGRDWRG